MKWRTVLAVLVGLLLPLPLTVLLNAALRPVQPVVSPRGKQVSPVLDTDSRTRLSTYRRDCALSSDCEAPLGCLTDTRILAQYCTDSQCATDAQCPVGQACQSLATTGDGPLVRFCIPVGKRQEGERCLRVPDDQEAACAQGLLCGGQQSWCGRPCNVDGPDTCPTGFFCADTVPEPLCLPSCESRECPAGQHCIRYDEGASACAAVYGADCQQSPCPAGRRCEVGHVTARPAKVWMECVERCGEGFPPCAAGMNCDGWQCRRACTPQEMGPCDEGYHCSRRSPDRPWVCQPDW